MSVSEEIDKSRDVLLVPKSTWPDVIAYTESELAVQEYYVIMIVRKMREKSLKRVLSSVAKQLEILCESASK